MQDKQIKINQDIDSLIIKHKNAIELLEQLQFSLSVTAELKKLQLDKNDISFIPPTNKQLFEFKKSDNRMLMLQLGVNEAVQFFRKKYNIILIGGVQVKKTKEKIYFERIYERKNEGK